MYLLVILSLKSFAQSGDFETKITALDSIHYSDPREKIFIHYDKPSYKLKDTLWMKGYIVTATEHLPNDSSRIVHVEVINAQNQVIKRLTPLCAWGLFNSFIALQPSDFTQGQYVLRAYTQHMRNFGDTLFFTSTFKILDPESPNWKINFSRLQLNGRQLQVTASVSPAEGNTSKREAFSVRLLSGNKQIFRQRITPDSYGDLRLDTLIKEYANTPLTMELSDRDNWKVVVPVEMLPAVTDLQFMPEGGTLLSHKKQVIAFKAINGNGTGKEISGTVKDSNGNILTDFASVHRGMGYFSLTPEPGQTYTAYVSDGSSVKLPETSNSGYLLHVDNTSSKDSLFLTIDGSADNFGKWVYFTISTRGSVKVWGRQKTKPMPTQISLGKQPFPQGITEITLYDENLLPVNERAIFIWRDETLQIKAQTHKPTYFNLDSVSLLIQAGYENGKAAVANFSLAVIDTNQIPLHQFQENILSYFYLQSDLAGIIEDPFFYFTDSARLAADLLMLTHGWVAYRTLPAKKDFTYEKAFSLYGSVTNIFNKPLVKSNITLFGKAGKNDMFLLDTLTDENGRFVFTDFPVFETDSISMVIKALNKRGKSFNVGIDLDEPDYPSLPRKTMLAEAANINTDSTARLAIDRQQELIEQFKKDGTYLKEVVVTAKAKIQGSKNLNSDGGSDQTINESTLNKTAKLSLLDVLQQQVKGFRIGTLRKSNVQRFMINSNITRFIIDGVDLEFFYQASGSNDGLEYLNYYKGYLEYFSAEDIKGIEIMNTPRYNSAYRSNFLNISEFLNSGPATVDYSFLEITTQSGEGPFMKKTPGIYLLKPVFPFIAKQFYSPRYKSPEDRPVFPDYRTTLYWNSNISTDSTGKARISFYTSESRGNYIMVLQGTDLNGRFGFLRQPVYIKEKELSNPPPKGSE